MKLITFTESELQSIKEHGCMCYRAAEIAMERNNLHLDDIEHINEHYEIHKWGSDSDRKYRERAVRKAINLVAANPLKYGK